MDEIVGASIFLLENGGMNGVDAQRRRGTALRMRVGLVGLGKMGQAIADRLLDAGYALDVFNRTPGRDRPTSSSAARPLAAARSRGARRLPDFSRRRRRPRSRGAGAVLRAASWDGAGRAEHGLGRGVAAARPSRLDGAGVEFLRGAVERQSRRRPRRDADAHRLRRPDGLRRAARAVLRAIAPTVLYVGRGRSRAGRQADLPDPHRRNGGAARRGAGGRRGGRRRAGRRSSTRSARRSSARRS